MSGSTGGGGGGGLWLHQYLQSYIIRFRGRISLIGSY